MVQKYSRFYTETSKQFTAVSVTPQVRIYAKIPRSSSRCPELRLCVPKLTVYSIQSRLRHQINVLHLETCMCFYEK